MLKPEENAPAPIAEHGRRFYFGWPMVTLVVSLAVLGAAFGYWLSSRASHPIARGVSVAGRPIGGLTAPDATALLQKSFDPLARRPVTLILGEQSWIATPATVGMSVDYGEAVGRAMRVGRRGGLIRRLRERRAIARQGLELPLTFRTDQRLWDSFCQIIEGDVDQDPISAHLTVDQTGRLKVSAGKNGRILDRATLLTALQRGFTHDSRRYELPIAVAKAELTDDDVAKWPLDQVLGIYTTKFNAGDTQRSNNLQMAAAALDGLVIKPGAEFSFNEHVGPRVPEKGYMEAPVIQKNRLVLGVGGGVCQVSGTLFNAVLLAGLPILHRGNHSQPSAYVPLGRDATVVYEGIDFVFANDSGRPIVLVTGITGSRLTIAAVGHRDLRPKVSVEVEVKEKIPYETITENDPGLAAGVQAVTQVGRDGYKVQLWRQISWPDNHVVREPIGTVAFYPPQKKIIKRGTGSPRFGGMIPPRPSEPPPPPAVPAPPALPPAGESAGGSP